MPEIERDPDDRLSQRNRQNAQKSTGPRTADGKAQSRMNATRHGITAQASVIAGESMDDWIEFCDDLLDALAPEGRLETELATRAAQLMWRLRRVAKAEADLHDPETIH